MNASQFNSDDKILRYGCLESVEQSCNWLFDCLEATLVQESNAIALVVDQKAEAEA